MTGGETLSGGPHQQAEDRMGWTSHLSLERGRSHSAFDPINSHEMHWLYRLYTSVNIKPDQDDMYSRRGMLIQPSLWEETDTIWHVINVTKAASYRKTAGIQASLLTLSHLTLHDRYWLTTSLDPQNMRTQHTVYSTRKTHNLWLAEIGLFNMISWKRRNCMLIRQMGRGRRKTWSPKTPTMPT